MSSKGTTEYGGDVLRVGIIGCGHWGVNYIRNFHLLPGAAVAGCCDIDPRRLEAVRHQYPFAPAMTDAADLLDNDAVDAVVVATTASTHFALVRMALDRGKHVLAEKPLTVEPAEALALYRLAERSKCILMVGHTFLYNPAVVCLRQLVQDGELGTVYYLTATRTHLGLVRKDINAVWDLSPHDVSIFNYVLNSLPLGVSAVGRSLLSTHAEDFAFISLSYPGGIVGNIFVSWVDSAKRREVAVVGSRARVQFDDLNNLERLKIFHKGISIDKPYSSFGEFQLLLRDGDIISPRIDIEEPLKIVCREFLRSIREQSPPVSDGLCGWEVVNTVKAIDQSIKSGGATMAIGWGDHPRNPQAGESP